MPSASCLCGGVHFDVDAPLGPVAMCHCSMCRKATGTAFATNASVEARHFHVRRGDDLIARFESSPGKYRCFCRRCGSPLFALDPAMPDHVRVRLGSFDDDPGARPAFHYDAESKAPWFEITDDLPRIPAAR